MSPHYAGGVWWGGRRSRHRPPKADPRVLSALDVRGWSLNVRCSQIVNSTPSPARRREGEGRGEVGNYRAPRTLGVLAVQFKFHVSINDQSQLVS
jgi:hypothetical protein